MKINLDARKNLNKYLNNRLFDSFNFLEILLTWKPNLMSMLTYGNHFLLLFLFYFFSVPWAVKWPLRTRPHEGLRYIFVIAAAFPLSALVQFAVWKCTSWNVRAFVKAGSALETVVTSSPSVFRFRSYVSLFQYWGRGIDNERSNPCTESPLFTVLHPEGRRHFLSALIDGPNQLTKSLITANHWFLPVRPQNKKIT